jgi:hypothetical protein
VVLFVARGLRLAGKIEVDALELRDQGQRAGVRGNGNVTVQETTYFYLHLLGFISSPRDYSCSLQRKWFMAKIMQCLNSDQTKIPVLNEWVSYLTVRYCLDDFRSSRMQRVASHIRESTLGL